jgi:hypothetical protein
VTTELTAVLESADALQRAGIEVADIAIQRPSLDDVFLSITSRDPSTDGRADQRGAS